MILLNDWAGETEETVFRDFAGTRWNSYKEDDTSVYENPIFAGFKILLASYSYHCYTGDAFVLAEKEGKLYEVNGGHCSCYGLEGQWSPEETSVEELHYRLTNGTLGTADWHGNVFANELLELLLELKKEPESIYNYD